MAYYPTPLLGSYVVQYYKIFYGVIDSLDGVYDPEAAASLGFVVSWEINKQ